MYTVDTAMLEFTRTNLKTHLILCTKIPWCIAHIDIHGWWPNHFKEADKYLRLNDNVDWNIVFQNILEINWTRQKCNKPLFDVNYKLDTRGGHFLCRAVRDARLYMGYFWEIFCTFSARWVPFFNKISVFFLQGGYLFWRKILYLSNKMEPIYKKFSVFYFRKVAAFYT